MSSPEQTSLPSDIRRIKLTILIASFALVLLLVNEIIHTSLDSVESAITLSIICLSVLYLWVNEDTVQMTSGIILWGTSTLVFYLSWSQQGIYDTALYAYPCIILLAYIMGSRLLFVSLVIGIFSQILLLVFAHDASLFPAFEVAVQAHRIRAIDLLIILTLFTSISFIFINGFKLSLTYQKRLSQRYKQALDDANKLLEVDRLTNLPNESVCDRQLDALLQNEYKEDDKIALVVLEITNMWQISHSLGHSISNQLLNKISHRLTLLLDANEYLFRRYGHEFVLLKSTEHPRALESFKERIIQAMSTEFEIGDLQISVNCSLGIAVAPFDGNAKELLIKRAHIALQHSKFDASHTSSFFNSKMEAIKDEHDRLIEGLKSAITKQQLSIHYQPKINLLTQQVVTVEALVRWHHPIQGTIPPSKFIPIAEKSGQISKITQWVIERACQDCAHWQSQGFKNICVAVNISASDFRRGNLPLVVNKAVNVSQLQPKFLELEITEAIIFNESPHIQQQIRQMQNKGVAFAIDDFGSGHSNIGDLNKLNVFALKIDRSFIKSLLSNEYDQHIVKAIIKMSESLGFDIVAKGVEERDTALWLATHGCQIGQGYYWSAPLPKDELLQYLTNRINAQRSE